MSVAQVPAFQSEAEEARWCYENRDYLDERFAEAVLEGRSRSTSVAQRVLAARQTAMVTLGQEDAAAATLLAEKRGVAVDTLLSELLHTAIQQETERAA
jgi:hypothetical protein